MNEITPTWKEAERLIDSGVSVIPIKKDKRPNLKSWKEYQSKIIDKSLLLDLLDKSEGIAIVCGFVSGNMEVIDLDTKYNSGFDAVLFQDLRDFYPEIYKRLRIQRTPSGGYHLIYRCKGVIEGNQKLAGRLNDEGKQVNFIETRGEGGYIGAYPSEGYTVVNDVEPPVLTQAERDSIISLCRSYNTIIEPQKLKYEGSKQIESSYDENPFDDFNNRCDAVALIEQFGYKFFQENARFIQFTRPGKKSGVSISFNRLTRCFFNFTASTDLEENKGYMPVTLLIKLQFAGDAKATYQYLIQNGYGKLKTQVERKIIKQAAQKGQELPANISDKAKSEFTSIVSTLKDKCQHGVFWVDTQRDGIQIDRERLKQVAEAMGFRCYRDRNVKLMLNIIHELKPRQFYDELRAYIHSDDTDEQNDIYIAFDKFCEKHEKWMLSRLQMLDEDRIVKDDRDVCYKHYNNGTLKITADEITFSQNIDGLIFAKSIQDRDYVILESGNRIAGKYVDFLDKAIGISEYLHKYIGFLCHEYKDEAIGYFPILTESVPDPKMGGGAGKNIFCNLLKYSTTVTSKPAESIKYDASVLQSWNQERLFVLSDAPKNFNFSFFKEYTTGDGIIKKLYKDEVVVLSDEMPKIIVQTNFSVNIEDGGMRRRVRVLEFTDFFTLQGGVDTYYGCLFPQGWTDYDWQSYDYFISQSIQKWLQSGCKLEAPELSEGGWHKMLNQTYKDLVPFIEDNFEAWVSKGYIFLSDFKTAIDAYYMENNINGRYSPQKVNAAIMEYSKRNGYNFMPNEHVNNIRAKKWEKVG
jgi:hypothetical protein